MQFADIPHRIYVVQFSVLRDFASISFTRNTPSGAASRRNTVTVADPVALYPRKDGQFTIRARDSKNTVTLTLRDGTVKYVAYDGSVITQSV